MPTTWRLSTQIRPTVSTTAANANAFDCENYAGGLLLVPGGIENTTEVAVYAVAEPAGAAAIRYLIDTIEVTAGAAVALPDGAFWAKKILLVSDGDDESLAWYVNLKS